MKDYKKILEGAVNIINTTEKSDIGFANICSYIGENCPELKESECELTREDIDTMALEYVKKSNPTLSEFITKESLRASYYLRGEYDTYRQGLIDMYNKIKK